MTDLFLGFSILFDISSPIKCVSVLDLFFSYFSCGAFVCMCVKMLFCLLSLAYFSFEQWWILVFYCPLLLFVTLNFNSFLFLYSAENELEIGKTCAHFIWIWFCFLNSVLKCATLKYNKNNEAHEKKRVAAKCFIANRFLIGTASI